MEIKEGTTDVTIPYKLRSSVDGTAKTGLVHNSAGAKCYYVRGRGNPVQIALVTLAAPNSAHADGGFKEKSASNMKGGYRLDLTDAVCAAGLSAGARFVTVHIEFTGVFAEEFLIELVGTTKDDLNTAIAALPSASDIWDETVTEPSAGQPPKEPSRGILLDWLWMHFRNKNTQNKDTGEQKLFNDAGTEIAKSLNTDDGTTFTKGKFQAP